MSLFKRLLFPKYKSDKKPEKSSKPDTSSYFPEKQLPADEKFTFEFRKNGGKFIYCENWEEMFEAFDNIMMENDWYEQDVFCLDKMLSQKFQGFNLNFTQSTRSAFFLSQCESLVANKGAILLSSNQMKEKKIQELPYNFIIVATTSQIVQDISDGLRIIKNQSLGGIPTNITTIQDFEGGKEKDFMSEGNITKNLYLLLLEDL